MWLVAGSVGWGFGFQPLFLGVEKGLGTFCETPGAMQAQGGFIHTARANMVDTRQRSHKQKAVFTTTTSEKYNDGHIVFLSYLDQFSGRQEPLRTLQT